MKTIVISGATRGLGLAITREALKAGYRVVAVGRKPSTAFGDICELYPNHVFFEAYDFENLAGIHDFTSQLVKSYGRFWGLVNNAAVGTDGVLATLHERDISHTLKVNIEAPILFTKYMLRPMLLNRAGRIVNITSIIASTGFSGLSVYAASKAALGGFTKSLAREVGKAGITVNNVAPGYMETDMTSALKNEKLEAIKRRSPLGCLTSVEDVAPLVTYLLDEKSGHITGSTFTIDAGTTA